ncbi:MAG TPA: hypothetical protein VFV90_01310 [Usitatibacter sp.]|nr:hypothetical protein [Usitatibacter sp.]
MSSFKTRYPEFASIEYQIRQAHAERALAIATRIADGIAAVTRGTGRLFAKGQGPKATATRA